jgi:TetR/AcrR family transcriptional repressor of bet genes
MSGLSRGKGSLRCGALVPLIVDHGERRQQISAIAARLIATRGVEAISLRDVAREAGHSTAAVLHYFRDKLHLLVMACRGARLRATSQVESAIAAGLSPRDCIAEFLPLDTQRRLDWLMWFGFWGKAAAEPAIAEERLTGVNNAHLILMRLLEAERLPADADLAALATAVQAALNGIASLAVIDVDRWPAERQRRMLRFLISPVLDWKGCTSGGSEDQ